ncbi:unnamed protein product [Meganyctiphanes norvegica]|uniref:NACHT domain-containing protein n=1 Tax=Meganyctiphanes norvegica TaxID=48144 RepID=A0AAV2S594_MEGNR
MAAFSYNRMIYEPEDYQFIRVYKCVNHVGRILLQNVFEWGLRLPPNKTLKEYIIVKNKFTILAYSKRYDEDQKNLIEDYNMHDGDFFDICILYKLIQDTSFNVASTYDKLWTTQNSSQLEYLIYSIKNIRNKIYHNRMSLDKADAHQMIEEFRNLFLNLVEAAGVRYGRDVTADKTELNTDIDEIINYQIMDVEIQQLFSEQFHERSKNKIVTEGAQEMKEKYKEQSDLNPLTLIDGTNFIIPVMKVYKKLEIQECGRHSKNILIDSNDILRLNESCKTVKDLEEAVDLVILQGPTGSGKTTITKLLLAEWSSNPKSLIKGLLDYNLLIYMECRNPDIESLNMLLHCLMPSTCNNHDVDPVNTLAACKVLIIMDSLDELNEHSAALVKELLELMKMKNVTGICTVRPTKIQDVFAFVPSELKTVHLKSRGIPGDQRGPFIEMYHEELRKQGKSDQSTQELMKHLSKSSSQLEEHLRYPINLVHLVYLWAIAPLKVKFVTTATELYSSIHEVVQIKLSERLIYNSLTKHLTDEERKKQTMKFLEALYIEALLNLTCQHFCILPKGSEAELVKVCIENDLPHSEMLSSFLVTKSLWTGFTVKTEYSISHTDMQEYLAACCIFNAVKDQNYLQKLETRICNYSQTGSFNIDTLIRSFRINTITKNPVTDVLKLFYLSSEIPLKNYQNVLKHLSGLFVLNNKSMSKNVAKDLVKLFKKSGMRNPEDWLDIYAENNNDKRMTKYLNVLCGDMLRGDIIVKDSRLAAYTRLLDPASSPIRAKSLMIKLEKSSSDLPDLQELMSHAIKLQCSVELHLYHNWRKPQPGFIHAILNETQKSCNLKVIRGSPSSNELCASYSTLKKLYISICDKNHATDALPMLNSINLPKLRAIYIHMKCGDVFSHDLFPLNFSYSTNIVLFLSNVDDRNIEWAVGIACALQLANGAYQCLYLPNNHLSSSGFLHLVHSLHKNNVKILVRIGVTSDIIDEDLDEALDAATKAATNLLQCDLLWYFSAERMEGW